MCQSYRPGTCRHVDARMQRNVHGTRDAIQGRSCRIEEVEATRLLPARHCDVEGTGAVVKVDVVGAGKSDLRDRAGTPVASRRPQIVDSTGPVVYRVNVV